MTDTEGRAGESVLNRIPVIVRAVLVGILVG